ncbi:hypothetical protein [Laceyella putida]
MAHTANIHRFDADVRAFQPTADERLIDVNRSVKRSWGLRTTVCEVGWETDRTAPPETSPAKARGQPSPRMITLPDQRE